MKRGFLNNETYLVKHKNPWFIVNSQALLTTYRLSTYYSPNFSISSAVYLYRLVCYYIDTIIN